MNNYGFLFLYMKEEESRSIKWKSKIYDDDICNLYKNITDDILFLNISKFGFSELNGIFKDIKDYKITFNNSVIKTRLGNNSGFSISATIAATYRQSIGGAFIIPPDLIDYINEEINSESVFKKYLSGFPSSVSLYEKGKLLFESFIKSGYPTQAAYALCGAAYVECTWDPNVYNKAERAKSSGTVDFAGGWSGCGEGLFGLTGWNQKKKLIEKMGLNKKQVPCYEFINGKINKTKIILRSITTDQKKYDADKHAIKLFQCTEDTWTDIMKEYLKGLGRKGSDTKTTYDYLMYDGKPQGNTTEDDDDHKLLYASYLFKAGYFGNNKGNNFNTVKKTVDAYKSTHQKIYGKNNISYMPINGFVKQLLIAYLLAEYINGSSVGELNLKDIIKININKVTGKETGTGGLFADSNSQDNNLNINDALYKKSNKKFDIDIACDWITKHSAAASLHSCAKYVRMAIEAGFRDPNATHGRPNWAWKYIDYLPTIGFKFLRMVHRDTLNTYKPEKGDIAVYLQNNSKNVPGHICMYTGQKWISDFKQNNMFVYRATNEAYIFRFNG